MYKILYILYTFCIFQYYLPTCIGNKDTVHELGNESSHNSNYNHIDEILKKWNTTYQKMKDFHTEMTNKSDNEKDLDFKMRSGFEEDNIETSTRKMKTEDLLAVFGYPDTEGLSSDDNVGFRIANKAGFNRESEVSAKDPDVESFSLLKELVNRGSEKLDGRAPTYFVDDDLKCNKDIAIQQRTFLIDELSNLLPYRSVMFISCKTNVLPKLSIRHSSYSAVINSKTYYTYVINAKDMTPNTIFLVNNRTVKIDSIESTEQILGVANLLLNIQNKNLYLYPAQFSYLSLVIRNATSEYANTLPFSQTHIVQLYTMGTILNTSRVPTKEERDQPSCFHDLVYCSKNRRCDGGNFIGKSDTPYAFQREDNITPIFGSLVDIITKGFNKFRYRQLVSQQSQFDIGVVNTGLFEDFQTAFVSENENVFGKKVQNELSHELGHSYDLPDYSGFIGPTSKLLHYSLQFSLEVSQPFTKLTQYKGSMNGGTLTNGTYTRLNRFSSERIYQLMKKSQRLPIKIKNTLKTGGSSLILVKLDKELFLFKLNIDIIPEPSFDVTYCLTCDTTVYVYRDETREYFEVFYVDLLLRNSVRIPSSWLNSTNFIIVKNNFTEKMFYLHNDAVNLFKPIEAVNPNNYRELPIDKDGFEFTEPDVSNYWESGDLLFGTFKNEMETIEDYEDYFRDTNYIGFKTENGNWKRTFYVPKHNFNETKIIYFKNFATYSVDIMYYTGDESLKKTSLTTNSFVFITTTDNHKWRIQMPIILNYLNYPNGEGLIDTIKLFNIVELTVPKSINYIEIPYGEGISSAILIINPESEIKVKLRYNFNQEIFTISNKFILTFKKKLDFDKMNTNIKSNIQ